MAITTRVTRDKSGPIIKRIAELTRTRVMVGVPSDDEPREGGAGGSNERQGEPINNATLAYIHDNGAPEAGIPARPFMLPGMERARSGVEERMKAAGAAALAGDKNGMDRGLGAAGTLAVNGIVTTIQDGLAPPLKQATIDRRRQRTKGSSYRRRAQTAADVKPLIDTAQMLRSISYVVRKNVR